MPSKIMGSSGMSPSSECLGSSFAKNVPEALEAEQGETINVFPRSTGKTSIRAYLSDICRISMLSREEELIEARKVQHYMELLERERDYPISVEEAQLIQIGKQAKSKLIQANLRLVVAVARKFRHPSLELLDFIQEGTLGLERAVEKFDPSRGYRFSTYAHHWIQQSIIRAIAHQGRSIRLPIHVTEKLNVLKKAFRQLMQEKGRMATMEELAKAVDSSPEEVRRLIGQARSLVSLDAKLDPEEDKERVDILESEADSPERVVNLRLMRETLSTLVSELDKKERMVIELRFGLNGGKGGTIAEIGESMNLTKEAVRLIEAKAMRKLRKPDIKAQLYGHL